MGWDDLDFDLMLRMSKQLQLTKMGNNCKNLEPDWDFS